MQYKSFYHFINCSINFFKASGIGGRKPKKGDWPFDRWTGVLWWEGLYYWRGWYLLIIDHVIKCAMEKFEITWYCSNVWRNLNDELENSLQYWAWAKKSPFDTFFLEEQWNGMTCIIHVFTIVYFQAGLANVRTYKKLWWLP